MGTPVNPTATIRSSAAPTAAPMYFVQLLLLAALMVFSVGCSQKNAPATVSENSTSGTLEVVADEQLRPVVDSLIRGFMLENPNAKLTARYVTSGQAIQDLLAQKARVILISRGLSDEAKTLLAQNKLELPAYDVAEDALGVVVRSDNPLEAIALSDIERIVRGDAKDWRDLQHSYFVGHTAGPALPITKELSPLSSSSEWLLDSLSLPKGAMQAGTLKRFVSTDSVLAELRKEKGGIAFIGAAWAHRLVLAGDSSLKLIPVIPADSSVRGVTQPIELHMYYVYQGLYPLTERVTAFSFEVPNTLPRGFIVYATTFHGQTVFKDFGVLPRTQHLKFSPPG